MSTPCEKHAALPVVCHSPCAGCEIERLKVALEALRQSIVGKVVCPLDLFQDLRDSAGEEAAQYRAGGMAEYRPHRMHALDKTVTDCDELIAAMSKDPLANPGQ